MLVIMGLAAEDAAHHALSNQITDQDTITNYAKSKYIEHSRDEMDDLYNWWKYERPLREKAEENHFNNELPKGIDALDFLDMDESEPLKKEYRAYIDKYARAEKYANQEDELQLIRLAKIRLHLWA